MASRWRELHGENSWKGLLDPLDPHLRASIISYGEMVQAAYDAFNTERRSPHCGACFYGHDDLLAGVGVPHHGNNYQVTKFVYATSSLPLPESFLLLPLPSCKPGKISVMASSTYPMLNKKGVMDLHWGLHRGLLSGLLSTTSGVPDAHARD